MGVLLFIILLFISPPIAIFWLLVLIFMYVTKKNNWEVKIMTKRELYKSKLENMNKEQLINYSLNLLEEVWDLENNRDKAIEELELWQPKIEALKIERDYLLDTLRGEDYEK